MTAEHLEVCPKCGERTLRRLIGKGGVLRFKGSGFYSTDYPKARREGGRDETP